MNCSDVKTLIQQDDSTTLPAEVAAHVRACPVCRSELALNERLQKGLRVLARTAKPPNLEQKILQKISQLKPAHTPSAEPDSWFSGLWAVFSGGPRLFFVLGSVILSLGIAGSLLFNQGTRIPPSGLTQAFWHLKACSSGALINRQPAAHGPLSISDAQAFFVPGNEEIILNWKGNTEVRLQGAAGMLFPDTLQIEKGSLRVSSSKPSGEAPLLIKTPLATLTEVGTIFLVEVRSDNLSVRVEDGSVSVETPGETRVVYAGQSVEVTREGFAQPASQTPSLPSPIPVSTPSATPVDRVPTSGE